MAGPPGQRRPRLCRPVARHPHAAPAAFRAISLPRDWDGGDADRAAFPAAVRDGACRFFRGVLGPDYNAAHADHFHFDRGRRRACR